MQPSLVVAVCRSRGLVRNHFAPLRAAIQFIRRATWYNDAGIVIHKLLATAAITVLVGPTAASLQDTGVLRVTVTLVDADGATTPIPRVVMLVSDNPSTSEPKRLRTGADGAFEVHLRSGNYTVESDRPVALGGQAYTWTQMIDVVAGSTVTLALTAQNAEVADADAATSADASPVSADAAAILNKWRGSVVEIWTPTTHASGFVIGTKGLIATDYRAIGDITSVEVELTSADGNDRVKVPGQVVASDRVQGVSIIWIAPARVSAPPVIADCNEPPIPEVAYNDRIVALLAPMLAPKEGILGTVGRATTQSFEPDWRLSPGTSGGPVFAADGRAIGITMADQEDAGRRRDGAHVLPVANICNVLAQAEKKIAGAAPPPATLLPIEPAITTRKLPDPKAPRPQPIAISSSDFDIALMAPAMMSGEPAMMGPRRDFGNWMSYVASAPPVLFVRISPQFEEGLWKMIARGAAYTQGIALPPLKSFNANFLRLRAFCDDAEVVPIHPFIIESRVTERTTVREGLYIFGLSDFARCREVRFDLYSEKAPNKADTRAIDPKLFGRIAGR